MRNKSHSNTEEGDLLTPCDRNAILFNEKAYEDRTTGLHVYSGFVG